MKGSAGCLEGLYSGCKCRGDLHQAISEKKFVFLFLPASEEEWSKLEAEKNENAKGIRGSQDASYIRVQ